MHDGLPHAGGLPVGAELLQILMDGVNGLIHLVHAVLQILWRSALDGGAEEPLKELSHEFPAAGWNHARTILHQRRELT